jgi:Uma2 family endonuclease
MGCAMRLTRSSDSNDPVHDGNRKMSTMMEAVAPVAQQTPAAGSVQQVILHGVSWETYERLLIEHEESSGTRFTYDQGALEIMVLSAEHEDYKDMLVLLINALAEELDIDVRSFGSTTLHREDLARGFEPDACFYIQNEARVSGKKQLDLAIDPPPDLVVEIDITHPSLNKFPIFSAVGVPEVWRYDGVTVTIFALKHGQLKRSQTSIVLPVVTEQMLTKFMTESKTLKRTVWLRRLREWVRTHVSKSKN